MKYIIWVIVFLVSIKASGQVIPQALSRDNLTYSFQMYGSNEKYCQYEIQNDITVSRITIFASQTKDHCCQFNRINIAFYDQDGKIIFRLISGAYTPIRKQTRLHLI